jgi:hypothetical protein
MTEIHPVAQKCDTRPKAQRHAGESAKFPPIEAFSETMALR